MRTVLRLTTGIAGLLICLCGLITIAHAQTFNGGGFTIIDNSGVVATSCATVAVSGVTANRSVQSISFNGFNHTYIGDLELRVYLPGAAGPPSTASSFLVSRTPNFRGCNYAGNYRFVDTAATTVDAATGGGCTTLPVGDYRASTYGGGTSNGTAISIFSTFGSLTPAQANGNWLVCAFDRQTSDTGSVTTTSVQLIGPSAAALSVSGRVMTANGNGIRGTRVSITDPSGITRSTLTGSFGYYTFDELEAGSTYVISVASKGFSFANSSIVHSANDNFDQADFIALPQ